MVSKETKIKMFFFVKNGEKCYLNYVMVIYSGLICDPLLLISFIFTEK